MFTYFTMVFLIAALAALGWRLGNPPREAEPAGPSGAASERRQGASSQEDSEFLGRRRDDGVGGEAG
jgi:hypothetical protein